MSDHPRTIRVLLHVGRDNRIAIGVLMSEWNGPRRVDLRMASARPLRGPLPPAPRGVPEALWLAHLALKERVEAWEDEALRQQR